MNKKAKGNNNQRIFAKYLRTLGWETETVRNTAFNHGDFFDVGDILAHNKEQWAVFQIKSNKASGAIKKMKAKIFPPGTLKYVAIRHDGNAGKPVRWHIVNADTGEKHDIPESEMQ